jgi:hypothetical protein
MSVRGTFLAETHPMVVPKRITTIISRWCFMPGIKNVNVIARIIPRPARRLPRLAVAGEESIFNPIINNIAVIK